MLLYGIIFNGDYMTDEQTYDLSKTLKLIRNAAAGLTYRDLFGYHHMVDTSEKGHSCTYAKHMKRSGLQPKELNKLKSELTEIKEMILKIEGAINEEENRTSSKETSN